MVCIISLDMLHVKVIYKDHANLNVKLYHKSFINIIGSTHDNCMKYIVFMRISKLNGKVFLHISQVQFQELQVISVIYIIPKGQHREAYIAVK